MFFDFIIFIIIITGFGFLYLFYFSGKQNHPLFVKYKKLFYIFNCFLIIGELVIIYGSFIEPKIVIVKHEKIYLAKAASEDAKTKFLGKIAVISDFHLGPFNNGTLIKKITKKIKQENPDAVLIVGDFLTNNQTDAVYFYDLKELASNFPTYVVFGNHDYNLSYQSSYKYINLTEKLNAIFKEINVHVLENGNILINNKFWLIGIGEIWARRDDLSKALKNVTENYPTVLMVHNPDFVFKLKEANMPVDLMLSGHTHGGQIRLPFLGPVPELPDQLGRRYDKGFFSYFGQKMYITSGLGTIGTRARLYNFPEIVIINLYE